MDPKPQNSQNPALRSNPVDPPSHDSASSTFGLERLMTLDTVDVREREVLTENGEVLFKISRLTILSGNTRTTEFNFFDRAGKLVISIRPKMSWFKSKYEVKVGGELAVVVRYRLGLPCRPTFFLHDAATRQKVLKINMESIILPLFRIKHINTKQPVGYFALKHQEGAERLITDPTEFRISVSQDLEVGYKAACIGICMFYIHDANVRRSQ